MARLLECERCGRVYRNETPGRVSYSEGAHLLYLGFGPSHFEAEWAHCDFCAGCTYYLGLFALETLKDHDEGYIDKPKEGTTHDAFTGEATSVPDSGGD